MIVSEVKIEKSGSANKKYGGEKEDYFKIMIFVFDRWWEWQPNNIRNRMDLQTAMAEHEKLRKIIHAN